MPMLIPENTEDHEIVERALTPDAVQPSDDVNLPTQLGAGFRRNTIPGALLARVEAQDEADETFGPFEPFDAEKHLTREEKLRASDFSDVDTTRDLERVREQERREREQDAIIAQGPLPEIVAHGVSIFADPTTYIGPGGAILATSRLATITANMARSAAIIGGAEAVREGGLSQIRRTHDPAEAATNILLGAALGGGFGALVGRSAAKAAAKADTEALIHHTFPGSGVSAGSATARATPEVTELVSAAGLEKFRIPGATPVSLDLMNSRIPATRELTQELVDAGVLTKGQVEGFAGPVAAETEIRVASGSIGRMRQQATQLHKLAKREGFTGNFAAFDTEIGEALIRGTDGFHPRIAEAAKAVREIFDEFAKKAKKLRLLEDDIPLGQESAYLTRVWNRRAIKENPTAFREFLTEYFRKTIPEKDVVSPGEYAEMAANVEAAIRGGPTGRTDIHIKIGGRGPLKERTFHIPDTFPGVEKWVDRRATEVLGRFVRTMSTEIAFAKRFGKGGIESAMTRIDNDADALAKANPKEADAIINAAAKDKDRLMALANIVRGTNVRHPLLGLPEGGFVNETMKTARALNFGRLLGGVVVSSFSDIGRLVLADGLSRTMFIPLRRSLDKIIGESNKIKLAKTDAQEMGLALNWVMTGRQDMWMEIGEQYASAGKLETLRGGLTGAMSKASGIAWWNDTMQTAASAMVITRMTRALRGGKVSARNKRLFAKGGIDEAMQKRIAAQAEHWEDHGGITVVNVGRWTDVEAADAFRASVNREVNDIIINPSAGDAPLWASSELGKSMTQFKKFFLAMHTRGVVRTAQERDGPAIASFMTMVSLGFAVVALKDYEKHGELQDREFGEWALEAIDRSGVTGVLLELDSISDKLQNAAGLDNSFSIQALAGGTDRFKSRDVFGQVAGPTAGLFSDVFKNLRELSDDDDNLVDMHKLRRLSPFQNLFYLNYLLTGTGLQTEREERSKGSRFTPAR